MKKLIVAVTCGAVMQAAMGVTPAPQYSCSGTFVNPITSVDWDGIFPISIGSTTVDTAGSDADTSNPKSPVCICPEPVGWRAGITIGYWEPFALTDVTRSPFCMVDLGGIQLKLSNMLGSGEVDNANSSFGDGFYYVHWYKFPLMYWLNILTDLACLEKSDFDIAYLTELDPTWGDDELAFVLNPEAILFSSVPAQAACAADALASSVHLPINELFWCAGAQGSMYPLTGHVQEDIGGVQASTLLTERMDFKMHRQGLVWDSIGADAPLVCSQHYEPIMPKNRYRYQMVNPVAATVDGVFPFGHTTATWGAGHEYPYAGENFGYLVWRKRNCCFM